MTSGLGESLMKILAGSQCRVVPQGVSSFALLCAGGMNGIRDTLEV